MAGRPPHNQDPQPSRHPPLAGPPSQPATASSPPPPPAPATFTAHIRAHLSQHPRQQWTRHYGPLVETLRQRGLLARLDALSSSAAARTPTSSSPRETLACLAATAHTLAEWALKLPGSERGAVARGAVAVVDGFGAAALERWERGGAAHLRPRRQTGACCYCCCCGGGGGGGGEDGPSLSAAEMAAFGVKIRAARAVLWRVLTESAGESVLAGVLGWIYRVHARCTVEVVLVRVVGDRLPGELVQLVREGLLEEEEEGRRRWRAGGKGRGELRVAGARVDGEAEGEEGVRVDRRQLARAGVISWLEVRPTYAVVA